MNRKSDQQLGLTYEGSHYVAARRLRERVNGLEGFSCLLVDARGSGLSGKPTGEINYR
jgi:hypothetical protein